jgi:hypothetical protein
MKMLRAIGYGGRSRAMRRAQPVAESSESLGFCSTEVVSTSKPTRRGQPGARGSGDTPTLNNDAAMAERGP